MTDPTPPPLVPAVDRAVQILNAFQSADELLGVSDISRQLALHKSTVYDILNTLAFHGLLLRDEETKKYRLGPTLARLGSLVGPRLSLREVARRQMHELAAQLGETVILGIPTADEHILIAEVAAPELDMQLSAPVGRRLHHSAGAPARVIHAALPVAALHDLLARNPLRPFTARTITDPAAYERLLAVVRRQGFATDDGEYLDGVRAIAAPIWDWRGLAGALYAVGFSARLTEPRLAELARRIPAAAHDISAELGGTPPAWWGNGHDEPGA